MYYSPVIGLEVHAQLLTRSKAFCSCPADYGAPPNSQTCPICQGMPGVLPVFNREMVGLAVRLALALGSKIRPVSQFARKNYFYPDLPKGYQISQYDQPLAEGGALDFDHDGVEKSVHIRRIHLEEDAGKSFHLDAGSTLVDLNRCGVPLIEIVSEPELNSPQEARAYLNELKRVLEHLRICSGDMEKGALRCDANVSLKASKTGGFGTATEVKNLNSFRAVQRALEYEVSRQAEVLAAGGKVVRETLLWDETAEEARPMRRKEATHDYRYFPEPDLICLEIPEAWLDEIRSNLPELPRRRAKRLVKQYGIHSEQAEILCDQAALADYYEATVAQGGDPQHAASLLLVDVLHNLKKTGDSIEDFPLSPRTLAGLAKLMGEGILSAGLAREVLQEMLATGDEAESIVHRRGISLVSDEATILPLIGQVLDQNPSEVTRYWAGETKLSRFFMGQLMKLTRGQGDPVKLQTLLERELQKRKA
jgi:aspartyl-tRNA(Asn)/glutamyl-tRNA(Gln) amidotransferase subunit B